MTSLQLPTKQMRASVTESIQRASKTDDMQQLMTLQSSNVSDTFEVPVGGRTFLTNMKMAFSELSLMRFRMT
jgi:hypothetical protein